MYRNYERTEFAYSKGTIMTETYIEPLYSKMRKNQIKKSKKSKKGVSAK